MQIKELIYFSILVKEKGADIISVLRTNVVGSMICCRKAVRRMSTNYGGRGGAIVNVSSGSAYIGNPGSGVIYAVSKGGRGDTRQ
jgi:NAD(P)-dependent dehydrogenase (short-subunit alcohol dehydrogenase family)